MVAIFMYLVFQLNAVITQPVADQATKLLVYGLLDLVSVVLVPLSPRIESVGQPDALATDERRKEALSNLREVMTAAKNMKAGGGIDFDSGSRIHAQLGKVFSNKNLNQQIAPLIEAVNEVGKFELADTTLFLACDLLMETWYRVAFEHHEHIGAEELGKLTKLTMDFIENQMPINYQAED